MNEGRMFPPALVPLLRERVKSNGGWLAELADDVLVQLFTTIFWAGLETYEGERNAIGVAFLGTMSSRPRLRAPTRPFCISGRFTASSRLGPSPSAN